MGFSEPMFIVSIIFTFLLFSSHYYLVTSCTEDGDEVEDEHPFTYVEGEKGPEKWGKLDPKWKACGSGEFQSPIDLLHEGRVEIQPNLGSLWREYKPASAVLKNRGHDIQVLWKGDAGRLVINGTGYKILQCHWHTPSEHSIVGRRFDMELHMVHADSNGKTAVIAILYRYGPPDPFLAKIVSLIKHIGENGTEVGVINPGEIKLGSRSYYRYVGSLTVPPCTEGVIWTVTNNVMTVSRGQVKVLRNAVHDGFEANARPIQDLDGRKIYLYKPKN